MPPPVLHVVVVGAGLGGLAAAIGIQRAGHKVTILEQSSKFHHVGAGIQIAPNAARILLQWGLIPAIEAHSVHATEARFRGWKDGRILHQSSLRLEERYGTPFYCIHRADFHSVLVRAAKDLGITIRLNAAVDHIDFEGPSVTIKGGETLNCDVVIGADGLNSVTKEILLGRKVPPHPTGDLAYRHTIREEDMRKHAILHELIDSVTNDIWMGPDTFVVGYLLKEGGFYNIVLVSPDTLPDTVDAFKATPQEMRDLLKGWDPKLQTLLELVDQTQKWRLLTSSEMEDWGHQAGKFTLLGDACHAMPPYLGQGAAMAVEDGAVLGALFEKVQDPGQVEEALKLYEAIRKPRTTKMVQGSTDQGIQSKMHDGEKQQERDRLLAVDGAQHFTLNWSGETLTTWMLCVAAEYPLKFCDPAFRHWLFGYDCVAEAEKAWANRSQVSH